MSAENKEPRSREFNLLGHMLEAVQSVRGYTRGIRKEEFIRDRKTQQAVILNILIIGEAATQIEHEKPDFAIGHPEIPWKQMRGMRNRMVHGYFEINLDVVWETIRRALPKLERQILGILAAPGKSRAPAKPRPRKG